MLDAHLNAPSFSSFVNIMIKNIYLNLLLSYFIFEYAQILSDLT